MADTEITTVTRCWVVYVERRVKGETRREYLTAADGSLIHTDYPAAYDMVSARIKAGWRKGVSEGLTRDETGAWLRDCIMTLTPPPKPKRTPEPTP